MKAGQHSAQIPQASILVQICPSPAQEVARAFNERGAQIGRRMRGKTKSENEEMRGCRDFIEREGGGEILVSMGQSEAACIIYSV